MNHEKEVPRLNSLMSALFYLKSYRTAHLPDDALDVGKSVSDTINTEDVSKTIDSNEEDNRTIFNIQFNNLLPFNALKDTNAMPKLFNMGLEYTDVQVDIRNFIKYLVKFQGIMVETTMKEAISNHFPTHVSNLLSFVGLFNNTNAETQTAREREYSNYYVENHGLVMRHWLVWRDLFIVEHIAAVVPKRRVGNRNAESEKQCRNRPTDKSEERDEDKGFPTPKNSGLLIKIVNSHSWFSLMCLLLFIKFAIPLVLFIVMIPGLNIDVEYIVMFLSALTCMWGCVPKRVNTKHLSLFTEQWWRCFWVGIRNEISRRTGICRTEGPDGNFCGVVWWDEDCEMMYDKGVIRVAEWF
ncbi:hypothetical protein BKA69DRAFT_1046771 [Paraphysoderma sedebokerense]|nr:hypothetical protein BKA69DRAFT_1046771 [Paraphysoderma sedebokerense]